MIFTPMLESTVFYIDGKQRNAERSNRRTVIPDDYTCQFPTLKLHACNA